jgi:hypothetical protein
MVSLGVVCRNKWQFKKRINEEYWNYFLSYKSIMLLDNKRRNSIISRWPLTSSSYFHFSEDSVSVWIGKARALLFITYGDS